METLPSMAYSGEMSYLVLFSNSLLKIFKLPTIILGRAANEAFNRFSAPAIEACTPALEQFTEEMFMRFMRQFTGTIPYHNIFPKIVHNLNKKPSLLS